MAQGGTTRDDQHRRQLDRLRNAARRARLLARPDPTDPPVPELESERPELGIFARHLKRRGHDDAA
jgi:hypothetical protein